MSPVSESGWSLVQPLHFVCVPDSRPSLSTAELISNADQTGGGRPPASCCHSFSGVFGDNNNQFVSGKTRRPGNKRKAVVRFHYHLSRGETRRMKRADTV